MAKQLGDLEPGPILYWFRRDLRLAEHPGLTAAMATGRPIIPVFVLDPLTQGLGAAPKWRLGRGLEVFARSLADTGSRLVLRRGPALEVLEALAREAGASAVWWTRCYDADSVERDTGVKAGLQAVGLEARSHAGALMFEPWDVQKGTGGFYRVFTPMWRAVQGREVAEPEPAPARLPAPKAWPDSDALASWDLGRAMNRGAQVVAAHTHVGAAAAADRLGSFLTNGIDGYQITRDLPGHDGTSALSAHLALGEIGPRTLWHAAHRADAMGAAGAIPFARQVVWREFAHHLSYHTPHITTANWRPDWDAFPWSDDAGTAHVRAWQQGRTGVPFVDAAMRQMYVTGTMHNRGRMNAASYLTKHLMTHWRVGLNWFAECLVDWDPANNAMGWQWAAGSGPDAAPYFRIFNPDTQLARFDPDGAYARAWIAEGARAPSATALSYFDAIPRAWGLSPGDPYPSPVVSLSEGRKRALGAYAAREALAEGR